jgi:hypothetical protein
MKIHTVYEKFNAQLNQVATVYPESPGLFDDPKDWDKAGLVVACFPISHTDSYEDQDQNRHEKRDIAVAAPHSHPPLFRNTTYDPMIACHRVQPMYHMDFMEFGSGVRVT